MATVRSIVSGRLSILAKLHTHWSSKAGIFRLNRQFTFDSANTDFIVEFPRNKADSPYSAAIQFRLQPIIVNIYTLLTFDISRTFICPINPNDQPQPKARFQLLPSPMANLLAGRSDGAAVDCRTASKTIILDSIVCDIHGLASDDKTRRMVVLVGAHNALFYTTDGRQ